MKPNAVSKAVAEAEVVKARVVSEVVAERVTETEETAVVPMAEVVPVPVAVAVAVAAVAEAEAEGPRNANGEGRLRGAGGLQQEQELRLRDGEGPSDDGVGEPGLRDDGEEGLMDGEDGEVLSLHTPSFAVGGIRKYQANK